MDADVFAYASRFTSWRPGNYVVNASVDGRLVPMPINLETLEILFDRTGSRPSYSRASGNGSSVR
jgi:UDP-galactopyranose mutase